MDSQNTSFSQPPSAIGPDEARRRFLASMGIGDPGPAAPAKSVQEDSELEENDEEVALSSSPEGLELPGAPKSSPTWGRLISCEVKPQVRDEDAPPSAFGETVSEFGSGFAISDSENGSFPFDQAPSSDDAEPSGNGLFSETPAVIFQPLGLKTEKKKSNRLIVFLVILPGLVCGAALASFVLPVGEYVEKARTFMEQKLNMSSGVDPALFLSEMVAPGAESAASQFPPRFEAVNAAAGTKSPELGPSPEPASIDPVNAPVEATVTP